MTFPLDSLAGTGKPLRPKAPDAKESAGLLRSGLARLKDAENKGDSIEGRFDLAYNPAHALCLAALRWHGYRPATHISFFKRCLTRWGLTRKSGAFLQKATRYVFLASMGVNPIAMSACSKISSQLAAPSFQRSQT